MTPNSADGMIERVARAIAATLYRPQPDMSGDVWKAVGTERKRKCEDVARAAIAAMREPTKAMLKVGPPFPYMDEYVWKTMIDEALK
jgi:hypothetical protein